jgi:outer membrane protein TolC
MDCLRFLCLLTMAVSLSWCSTAVAQSSKADTIQFNLNKDLADQILSLEELYQLALQNSPLMREMNAQLEIQTETNRITKLGLLSGVGASAGYSKSNQSLLASGGAGATISNTEGISVSNGYRMSFQVGLSLGGLLGYRSTLRQAQASYRSAIAKQDGIKLGLRREISHLYQSLLTNQKIVNAIIGEEQKALIVFQTAEIDWHNGRSDMNEYAQASGRFTDTRIKTETARGNLIGILYDLSAVVGVDMIRLKAK